MGHSEYLANRGLMIVEKYVVVFWSEKNGWSSKIANDEMELSHYGSFGDYTGHSVVSCVVLTAGMGDD